MKHAIQHAKSTAKDIDYINPHGTASTIGDETEMRAILDNSLSHAYINATKSITWPWTYCSRSSRNYCYYFVNARI